MQKKSAFKDLPIIVITGPTAAGKTEAAVCLAERTGAEIVSCDSMQIYKGVDIGTAKPFPEHTKKIPHHLIGMLEPGEVFSAAEYVKRAAAAIEEIKGRGKNVIVSGGTGLYLKSLFEGIFEGPSRDEGIRKGLEKAIEEKGLEHLYEKLVKKDPEYAFIISKNDSRRIVRALEVMEKTGGKFSILQKNKTPLVKGKYRIYCFTMKRDELYRRVEERVDDMMGRGLLAEAEGLYRKKLPPDATLRQAIGYKELFGYFEGRTGKDEAVALIKKNTRHFAKRQLTWFRKMKNVVWIDALKPAGEIAEKIMGDALKEN